MEQWRNLAGGNLIVSVSVRAYSSTEFILLKGQRVLAYMKNMCRFEGG